MSPSTLENSSTFRVIGIDPGTRFAGYGIVEVTPHNKKISALCAGAWKFDPKLDLARRLGLLLQNYQTLIQRFSPQYLCIEKAFVAVNIRSALMLGSARGVILAASSLKNMTIQEMNPTAVKKQLTGQGYTDKTKMAELLSQILNVSFDKLPLDASDALAMAYVYACDILAELRLSTGKEEGNKTANNKLLLSHKKCSYNKIAKMQYS